MAHTAQNKTSISQEFAALRAMTDLLDKPDNYALKSTRILVVCYDQLGKPAIATFDMQLSQFSLKHRSFADDAQMLAEDAGFTGPFHCYTADQLHDVSTDGHTALDKFKAMAIGHD